jgi:hypothetical protein
VKFYRAKITLLASVLVLGYFSNPAKADNANPPRITSVEQVTTGPYSVGDIVTFKVGYEGGNPGIQEIRIEVNCIRNSGSVQGGPESNSISWSDGEKLTNLSGGGLISGTVIPCLQSELFPYQVTIIDKTRLQSVWDRVKLESQPSLKFIINESDLLPTPAGEVKPIKIKDTVSIKNIPKTPLPGSTYKLPRFTDNGAPLTWRGSAGCSITWDTFLGDLGGNLNIKGPGICSLRFSSTGGDKYRQPTVTTSKGIISPSKNGSTVPINFRIGKAKK